MNESGFIPGELRQAVTSYIVLYIQGSWISQNPNIPEYFIILVLISADCHLPGTGIAFESAAALTFP